MSFRVYSGPRGAEAAAPIERDRMLYKEFGTLDEAMAWARHLQRDGRTAMLIEGDDGTTISKHEIAAAL